MGIPMETVVNRLRGFKIESAKFMCEGGRVFPSKLVCFLYKNCYYLNHMKDN